MAAGSRYEDNHAQKQEQHDQEDSKGKQQVRAAVVPHAQFQLATHNRPIGNRSYITPDFAARLHDLSLRRIELRAGSNFLPSVAATREDPISAILKKARCIQTA